MANKYIVTASPAVVPVEGYHLGGGAYIFELEAGILADLSKKYPTAFTEVSKKEHDETKKKLLFPGSATGSAPTPSESAPAAEEKSEVTEAEALKVGKVKEPEKKSKKKGKS